MTNGEIVKISKVSVNEELIELPCEVEFPWTDDRVKQITLLFSKQIACLGERIERLEEIIKERE